jgi:hypothetical protein
MMVVACFLILVRVPSVRNLDSITLLIYDHMLDIGVKENNGVTLSKSLMEGTRVRNQICMQQPSFLGYPNETIRERCTSQLNVKCIIPKWVTHMFAKVM